MVIKLTIILLLLPLLSLQAQSGRFFLDNSGPEPRFTQQLTWSGGGNVLYYEVVIEREEHGQFWEHERKSTESSYINVELKPGRYRYRVIPHDLLDRPREGSAWRIFQVLTAQKPELHDFSPAVFTMNEAPLIVHISGKNLYPDESGIGLRLSGSSAVSILPMARNISFDNAHILLTFDHAQLAPGTYDIYVKNPGGLDTSMGSLTINPPDPPKKTLFVRNELHFWSLGVFAGTSFIDPWAIGTVRATLAPLPYSFLAIGLDVGFISTITDAQYYSLCPFLYYAYFRPITTNSSWYAGAGASYTLSRYTFSENTFPENIFAIDIVLGVNFFNMLDISYTLRTNFDGASNKIAIGYTYRF
ncbi:MAG: porin family protein [Treponema sp.]|nr:porin family protein [Treponema sp.]